MSAAQLTASVVVPVPPFVPKKVAIINDDASQPVCHCGHDRQHAHFERKVASRCRRSSRSSSRRLSEL